MANTVRSEFGKDHGVIHEMIVTGRKVGAGEEFYSKLAHDEALFGQVVTMVIDGAPLDDWTHLIADEAAEIMGGNFHGIIPTDHQFNYMPTEQESSEAAYVPFSRATLASCRHTHILVWLAPLSLVDVWEKQKQLFWSKSDPWYVRRDERKWAKAKIKAGYYLIRKEVVPGSPSKNWDEQQALLQNYEEVPSAAVMTQAVLLYIKETGERLFESLYVRTSDVGSDGIRVDVGCFGVDGLYVGSGWDDSRSDDLGLASSRKSS